MIPPYDHPDVIGGQGTAGLELFAQVPHLDAVIIPVGGGGLLSGITLASNLKQMFKGIVGIGADMGEHAALMCPDLLIESMSVSGEAS